MSNSNGISREKRTLPPTHFTLKIKSYSLLPNAQGDNFESGSFKAGGYRWKLILYPNGESDNHRNGHISLYLAIDKPNSSDWSVPVNFKLFVLNQETKRFLTIKDASPVTYFTEREPKHGFRKFLSLEEFKSKRYLVKDCCTFGAEVFVIRRTDQNETLTMVKREKGISYTWKIDKFSKLKDKIQRSEEFTVEGRNWKIFIDPKGNDSKSGKHLSLDIKLADWESVSSKRKVYAKYKLRILGYCGQKNVEKTCRHWFSSKEGQGYDFMPLKDIYKNGYLKNDTLTVEVEFEVISAVTSSAEK